MARDAKQNGENQAAATKTALDNAADSLRVAQAGLKASHRPWLKFTARPHATPTDARTAFSEGGVFYLSLQFEMENVGNEPAFNVTPEFELLPDPLHGDDRKVLLAAQQRLIQEHDQGAVNMGALQGGLTIFPGEKVPVAVNVNLAAEVVADALAKDEFMAAVGKGTRFHWLQCNAVGCIFYRAGDQSPHHTGFAYGLGVVDGFVEGANIRVGVPVDAPGLTPDKLLLYPKYWQGNLFLAT